MYPVVLALSIATTTNKISWQICEEEREQCNAKRQTGTGESSSSKTCLPHPTWYWPVSSCSSPVQDYYHCSYRILPQEVDELRMLKRTDFAPIVKFWVSDRWPQKSPKKEVAE